jgi:hypothetical protein
VTGASPALLAALLATLAQAPAVPSKPVAPSPRVPARGTRTWKVTGTDVTFELSAKDLRAQRGGKEVFGLRARMKRFLADFRFEPDEDTSNWEASESLQVLSVVGPFVSLLREAGGYTGGAHPYASTGYATEDVTREDGAFSLLAHFPEKDVLAALKADGFVRKNVSDAAAFAKASTVEALVASLGPESDCVGFSLEDVQHSVAFHHLEGDKVAVRVAFGYASEACRGSKYVVGLLLPVPPALKPALERAARREEGFLMKDAKAAGAPTVSFQWRGEEPASPKAP